ncbi:cytotoxic translational repressor of toxin-antitoxin stability system [Opitutaceae bacterium TAV1]|nr:cytotoxic translational repressor of toxin-antitoxin stability system [Opitutaceae bacterium TAV1]
MSAYTVKFRQQVSDYIRQLGPDEKKRFKRALTALSLGKGDVHALKGELEGYHRLRIGAYRVIYWYRPNRIIECIHAGLRSSVYEIFTPED